MNFARIVNGFATDVRTDEPTGYFTDNIVAEFESVPDDVMNGWYFNGGVWGPLVVPPYIPTADEIAAAELAAFKATVPQSIPTLYGKLALLQAGLLDAAVAAVTTLGPAAVLVWTDVTNFQRNDDIVLSVATILNLTERNLDDLFIAAGQLAAAPMADIQNITPP